MRLTRFATIPLVLAAMLAAQGCTWFHRENKLYAADPSSRPLEVPPDLDLPRTDGSVAAPVAQASASASAAPVAGVSNGFTIAGTRDDAFAKVGEALAKIDGLTVASRAQLPGVYDVSYEGSNFLVRVSTVEAGAYVAAVDPRGQPATAPAAVKTIAALKAALASN
jgi:uncharacterized lipoprotein